MDMYGSPIFGHLQHSSEGVYSFPFFPFFLRKYSRSATYRSKKWWSRDDLSRQWAENSRWWANGCVFLRVRYQWVTAMSGNARWRLLANVLCNIPYTKANYLYMYLQSSCLESFAIAFTRVNLNCKIRGWGKGIAKSYGSKAKRERNKKKIYIYI